MLIKRRDLDTDIRTQEECHVNIKAEMRWCHLQAKGHQKVSENHQEPQERSGTDVPDSPQKEPPRRYLISNIPPPELWNNKFLLTTQIVVLCYRRPSKLTEPSDKACQKPVVILKCTKPLIKLFHIQELTLQIGSHTANTHVQWCTSRCGLTAKNWKRPKWPSVGH